MEFEVVSVWAHSSLPQSATILNSTDKDTLVIIGYQEHEPWHEFHRDSDMFSSFFSDIENGRKHLYIITGACPDDQTYFETHRRFPRNSKVFSWPYFFFKVAHDSLEGSKLGTPRKVHSNHCPLFCSLNNQPHYHRCAMMDILAKTGLLKKGAVSWSMPERVGSDKYGNRYEFRYWNPEQLILDEQFLPRMNSYDTLPIEFYTSKINLVTESTDLVTFVTEKVTMPLLLERPFVTLGAPGYHRFLESLGFALYDELVDYSFDKEKDLFKRCKLIADQIIKIDNYSYSEINTRLGPKLRYNRELAVDISKNVLDYIPLDAPKLVKEVLLQPDYYVQQTHSRWDLQ